MKMKKYIIITAIFCAMLVKAAAQTDNIGAISAQTDSIPTMAEVMKLMPDSLLPYLTHNDKLDMIDYLEAKMKAEVTNKMGGKSTLDSISSNYLHLTLNEAVTIEMGIAATGQMTADSCRHAVCVITTYGNPAMESTLKFYTTKWNEWQPSRPIVPNDILPPTCPDSYVTAKFGKNVEDIILTLSKPALSDEKSFTTDKKRQKTVKWGGDIEL